MIDVDKTDARPTAIEASIGSLVDYCRRERWAGFDPYDALNSRVFAVTPLSRSRLCRIAFTQVMKRLPFNIRPVLGISKEENPKATSLFLMAALKLSRSGLVEQSLVSAMADRLEVLRSADTRYWSWGYSFPWQTRTIAVPRGTPNLVSTSFAASALLDAYELDPQPRYLTMAASAAEYILHELYWTDGHSIASFSYPLAGLQSRVHNANFLAAAVLCRVHKYLRDPQFLDTALSVARYSVGKQEPDGSWRYGEGATQRWIDNFHTGYNLCALRTIGQAVGSSEFEPCIRRGFDFYLQNFFDAGTVPKYFHDRTYPVDIHCVAQSIITLITLKDLNDESTVLACKVLDWAMNHMWDQRGYFYYQLRPLYTNKLSFMRWSQAWMLLALATLLEEFETAKHLGALGSGTSALRASGVSTWCPIVSSR